jgi:hypothetical protein
MVAYVRAYSIARLVCRRVDARAGGRSSRVEHSAAFPGGQVLFCSFHAFKAHAAEYAPAGHAINM